MTPVDFIGESDCIKHVKEQLGNIARFPYPIFIRGETGSGKEVAARYIHECSDRQDKPFVSVDCGTISADLLPNEIFGHDKGAYTGSGDMKKGKIEIADGGYILFDEFKKMIENNNNTLNILLGFLGDGYFSRIGGTREHRPDVRIIAADSLEIELSEDLHDRFTSHIRIPSLRERPEDILLLAKYFSEKTAKENNLEYIGFSEDEKKTLQEHQWPRNIRQLERVVQRHYINGGGLEFTEKKSDKHGKIKIDKRVYEALYSQAKRDGIEPVMEGVERRIVEQAIEESGNNTYAAEIIKVSYRSFKYRRNKHGLSPSPTKTKE
ncbi:sigma-54-dependent transcriptional regulator [Bacteroidota bacterium]